MNNIDHPILNVAGWFDTEDFMATVDLPERKTQSRQSKYVCLWSLATWWLDERRRLIVGGLSIWKQDLEHFKENVDPFFAYHLKGRATGMLTKQSSSKQALTAGGI